MGVFSTMTGKGKVGSGRTDLGTGTYLLKLEAIETPESRKKNEYLKAHFTVLKVVADPEAKALSVGAQPTYAMFPDARYSFFEQESRQLLQGLLDLTVDEVNALPPCPPHTGAGLTAEQEEYNATFPIRYKGYKPGESIAEIYEAAEKSGGLKGTVLEARCWVRPNEKKPAEKGFQKAHFKHVPAEKVAGLLGPELFKEYFPQ